jgi:hypothetical protein
MPLSRKPFFLRMAISHSGLSRWYLVLGGVAVGHGLFEPKSDLELFSAKNMNICSECAEHDSLTEVSG